MATIGTVTDSGEEQAAEAAAAQPVMPVAAPRTVAAVGPQSAAQRHSMTLVVTVSGAVVAALIGGMFLIIVSALDDLRSELRTEIGSVRGEIGSLRSEMNDRFTEVDRRFEQVHSVLLDHTDRLARIETALDISGRSPGGDGYGPADMRTSADS